MAEFFGVRKSYTHRVRSTEELRSLQLIGNFEVLRNSSWLKKLLAMFKERLLAAQTI